MTEIRHVRSARATAVLAAVVVALGVLVPTPASAAKDAAAQQRDIDSTIRSLREQVAEASEAEATLLDRLDDVEAVRRELDAELRRMDAEVAAAEANLDVVDEAFGAVQAQYFAASERYDQAVASVRAAKRELRTRAVAAYMGHGSAELASALLGVRTPGEFSAATQYAGALVDAQARTVEQYNELRDISEQAKEEASARRDQAAQQRQVVAGTVEHLETLRNQQARARKAVADQAAAQAALVAEVRSRKGEFLAQIQSLQRQSDSIGDLIRRSGSGGAGTLGSGVLSIPVSPARVTSRFGPRVHPIFGDSRMHNGMDFGVPHGTPIWAAAGGTVLSAGVRGGYGNTVIIDHGNGLATLYAHQSRIAVLNGQKVERGDVVGFVGATGYATGPHLHFEVRANGTPVDPARYL